MQKSFDIPILGIIGVLVSIYFVFIEPKIVMKDESLVKLSCEYETTIIPLRNVPQAAMLLRVTMPFVNNSIKRGKLEKIQILPNNIPQSDYKIENIRINSKSIGFKETDEVYIEFLVYQSKFYKDPNSKINKTEELRLTFFDNYGNAILNKNGEIASLIISGELTERFAIN